ncbi:hypothetical protein BG015_011507, partial [Linnemannia schmuckeri]
MAEIGAGEGTGAGTGPSPSPQQSEHTKFNCRELTHTRREAEQELEETTFQLFLLYHKYGQVPPEVWLEKDQREYEIHSSAKRTYLSYYRRMMGPWTLLHGEKPRGD